METDATGFTVVDGKKKSSKFKKKAAKGEINTFDLMVNCMENGIMVRGYAYY